MARHKVRSPRRHSSGFTLVEIVVVVFIAGILLTMGMKLLQSRVETTISEVNFDKQRVIQDALVRYLAANKRLPCPDVSPGGGPGALGFSTAAPPDGFENRLTAGNPATACANPFGVLPYSTLGLSREAALDGWQNFFSYQVSTAAPRDWTTNTIGVGTVGGLTIQYRPGAGAPVAMSTEAAVVVFSHGKNGAGAFTAAGTRNALPVAGTDEFENTNQDLVFFKREVSEDSAVTGGAFDDLLVYMTNLELFGPLFKDGSARSVQAKLSADSSAIADAFLAKIARDSIAPNCLNNMVGAFDPTSVPTENRTDPWGTAYAVTITPPTVTLTTPTSGIAFAVTSSGPDKAAATGDDISYAIPVGTVQGRLTVLLQSKCP